MLGWCFIRHKKSVSKHLPTSLLEDTVTISDIASAVEFLVSFHISRILNPENLSHYNLLGFVVLFIEIIQYRRDFFIEITSRFLKLSLDTFRLSYVFLVSKVVYKNYYFTKILTLRFYLIFIAI